MFWRCTGTSGSDRQNNDYGRGDRIVELLRIGRIAATGHNRLGPVEAVPVVVRLQNGAKVEEKILVQFRQMEGRQSCVFHGPYGFPREIE